MLRVNRVAQIGEVVRTIQDSSDILRHIIKNVSKRLFRIIEAFAFSVGLTDKKSYYLLCVCVCLSLALCVCV